ncbi:MAG: HlyD family efflux transporter periplasmic adaptor subunit [Desulfobacteraceae bacterium]|nr:HlyD family efflux transporter periplasmic adaptor subunit [Desulfobacteraceae bacterium]
MTVASAAAGNWPKQEENNQKELVAPLREDLKFLKAPPNEDGSPAWMLHDPVRNQFYRIGWKEFEILRQWQHGDIDIIVTNVNTKTTMSITADHVQEILMFLQANQLLNQPSQNFVRRISSKGKGIMTFWVGFLYQRVPLIQPDSFLESTLPLIRLFFLKEFWLVTGAAGFLAGYLTLRQWDSFIQSFLYLYSFEGLACFAVALTMVKAGHEMAHAYTAKRYGLHIPVMGVAFIIFWPILFTDTTDGWKLKTRGNRIKVSIAGVAFEITIAIFAILFWHIVPAGPVKSAMFLLATTTWMATLLMNLNPFMRFDGYYVLSDFVGIPNLQPRSFTLGRWFLRRLILGIKSPCPENLSVVNKTFMVVYAFSTWVYRCFLYTGIALLVYHLFFKLLGFVFLIAEIGTLIVLPVIRELKAWVMLRPQLKFNVHIFFSTVIFAGIVFLLVYPFNIPVNMPAVYKTKNFTRIFASGNAQIKEVRIQHEQKVKKGDILFVLSSPDIEFQKKKAQLRVHQLQIQLKRVNFTKDQADQLQTIEQQLVESLTKLSGVLQKEHQLEIVSPMNGSVSIIADSLFPGRWINESDLLALIIDSDNMIVEGYIHELDRGRIRESMQGIFYPSDTEENKINVHIQSIAPSHADILDEPYLASMFGGALPVREEKNGAMTLQEAYYKVIMRPALKSSKRVKVQRGTVKIQGIPVSYFSKLRKNIQSLLIRESGF